MLTLWVHSLTRMCSNQANLSSSGCKMEVNLHQVCPMICHHIFSQVSSHPFGRQTSAMFMRQAWPPMLPRLFASTHVVCGSLLRGWNRANYSLQKRISLQDLLCLPCPRLQKNTNGSRTALVSESARSSIWMLVVKCPLLTLEKPLWASGLGPIKISDEEVIALPDIRHGQEWRGSGTWSSDQNCLIQAENWNSFMK